MGGEGVGLAGMEPGYRPARQSYQYEAAANDTLLPESPRVLSK